MITILLRTTLIYFFILLIMKFMGKREIGQLSLFDLVVLLLIADISIASISEDTKIFFTYCMAIIIISVIQKILAKLSLKIPFIRKIFDGQESIIILNGKLNIKEMQKQSYSMDDLLIQVRLKNVGSLSEVKHLFLETNGEISIFKFSNNVMSASGSNRNYSSLVTNQNKECDPFPVIVSGKIVQKNLKILNISSEKVNKDVTQRKMKVEDIYYAQYEDGKLFIMDTL